MTQPMRLTGRTALITGAGSGMGRELALNLANRACHLALVDRNAEALAETAALIPAAGLRISTHVLDIASREQVAALPAAVLGTHKTVDLLFNNAGVALGGMFEQLSEEEFDWLFEINFHGLVRMTRAFLPLLRTSDDARIINLSSLFGLVAPPGQSAYAASKFAVRGFSEALRHELEGSSIGLTVVHPGGVATNIANDARIARAIGNDAETARARALINRSLVMPPARAAAIIIHAAEHRKPRVLVGKDAKLLAAIARIAPAGYWNIIKKLLPKPPRALRPN
jgi:short-subunit dehydrogenase